MARRKRRHPGALTVVRPAALPVKWRKRSLDLVDEVLRIFDDFDGTMSTRQVFYQLVSRGAVENTGPGYERSQRFLVKMRQCGLVSYDRVVDRTRAKHHRRGWNGAEDMMESAALQYRRNYWSDQEVVPLIAVEKQALEGVFADVVDDYGAALWVLRGYASEAFAFEWATEIRESTYDGRAVRIFYFGDHDPSGLSLEQDAIRKLRRFGAKFEWERRGLLAEDFAAFDLVNVPVKQTDSRAKGYLREFGNRAAELDALPPDELARRIRAAIEECIDPVAWERIRRVEKAEKESLALVSAHLPIAVEAVRRVG